MGARLICIVTALVGIPTEAGADAIPNLFPRAAESEKISVVVSPGLRSMTHLPPGLRDARRRMHRGAELSDAALRALAGYNDGLAALRYVHRLRDRQGADASDIAYYSAIAVGTGRVYLLDDMVEAMSRLDPATEPRNRVNKYIQVLYPHAWAGNALALDAVIAFNGDGRLFGPLSDATLQRILQQAEETGDGRAELYLALRLIETGSSDIGDHEEARGYLARAAASEHPGIAAAAMALQRRLSKQVDTGGG